MTYLKKLITYFTLPLFVLSLLLFSNCNKDSEDANANSDLIGTWNSSSVNVDLMVNGKTLSQFLIDGGATEAEAALFEDFLTSDIVDSSGDGEIQFKSDNTYIANFGGDPETGKWSYNASTGILIIDSDDPTEDTQEIKVKSLTSTTLIIEDSEIMEEDIDDDGTTEQISISIEMTFTKA